MPALPVKAPHRVGYLSVWSSGELDCEVVRGADLLVLNEHRYVQSIDQLEAVLATLLEVVSYADPREPPRAH